MHLVLLGDSITELACWRAMVWDMLVRADLLYEVLFVGSKTNNAHNCRAQSGTFDLHHESHDGIQSVDVADHYLEGWLSRSKPDIVQIMLGTNDVRQGRATSDIIDSYTRMTDLIRESNPHAKIIVRCRSRDSRVFKHEADDTAQIDQLIPLASDPSGIEALNEQIPLWVGEKSSGESPITIADCSTNAGYTISMNSDGTHPNEAGDWLISAQVGPPLVRYVKDIIAERKSNDLESSYRLGKGNEELK